MPRLSTLTRLARALLLLLVAAVAVVMLTDALEPAAGERGSHSVAVVMAVVGSIALAQLVGSLLARHGSRWRPAAPLWSRSTRRDHRQRLPAVVELEALIISASTGGPRARERLDRRLVAMGCTTLASHLQHDEPTSQQVIDAVEEILDQRDGVSRQPDGPHQPERSHVV